MPWPERMGIRLRDAWLVRLCALIAFAFGATTAIAQTESVTNTAQITLPDGLTDANPDDNQSSVTVPIVTIGTSKTSDIGAGTPVQIGQTITYTTTVTMSAGTVLSQNLTLTDTLGPGLSFGAVTVPGPFTCIAANPLVCTLPAGTGEGNHSVTYTATVNASAVQSVSNSVVPSIGGCTICTIENPLVPAAVTYGKIATLPLGQTAVEPGDRITYTMTVAIASAPTSDVVTLTDTLGPGLVLESVAVVAPFSCNSSNPLVCTLPAATPIGSYHLSYTAQVDATATGSVRNALVGAGNDNPVCNGTCEIETPLVPPVSQVNYSKIATLPAGKTTVSVGDTITYTLSTSVSNSPTSATVTLTDTLGPGLSFSTITSTGPYTCNATNPLVCTLPPNTPVGIHSLSFTAVVDRSAANTVRNALVGTGDDDPICVGSCVIDTPFVPPEITYAKDVTLPPGRTAAQIGDTLTYTLSTTVAGAATTAVVTLTDTIGAGLTFVAVTSPGQYTCNGANPLVCTLPIATPIGSYPLTYTATVNASAGTSVTNAVVGSGDDGPFCNGECDTTTPVVRPTVTYAKAATLPPNQAVVNVGDTITYTLSTTVADAPTTAVVTLTDTLGPGLVFAAVTSAGNYTCNAAAPLVCTLPAGSAIGTHSISYTATVAPTASGSVTNAVVGSGDDDPACAGNCSTDTPLAPPADVTYAKAVTLPAGKTEVAVGDTLTYTLSVTVATSPTIDTVTLTDTLDAGLTFGSVTSAGNFTCNAANPLVCTLPAATPLGTYSLSYTATVDAAASGAVRNAVVGAGGDTPTCTGTCTTETPLTPPEVTYAKSATLPSGKTAVNVGDTMTYTLTVTVNSVSTTDVVTLTDTLDAGLTFGSVTSAGSFACNAANPLVCTLPAATPVGTYPLTYTATVNDGATNPLRNAVVGSGGDTPTCSDVCTTETTFVRPEVAYSKAVTLSDGRAAAQIGDTLTYTLSTVVSNASTLDVLTLTDTLGPGATFGAVTSAGSYTCNAATPLVCTLPAGTPVGTYTLTYTVTIDASASGPIGNTVVGSGGDDPVCTGACATETPFVEPAELIPAITVTKVSAPPSGAEVQPGQAIQYTLVVTVANAATTSPLTLTDTPDPGLTIGALPAGCVGGAPTIICTLPTGTTVGRYDFVYSGTVNATAGSTVTNVVVANGGSTQPPECVSCTTSQNVTGPQLRITKIAGVREVKIGDLVPYTLQIDNIGEGALIDGYVVDSPPAGFSFVAGSLRASNGSALTVTGNGPVRFGGLNLVPGDSVALVYLIRVGAGVRQGTQVNQARALSAADIPVSNTATASVVVVNDPLTDESLILGTVFDDRDGDGWQDSAALTKVRIQGGFPDSAYVPNSTTIDRGKGFERLPDASAPLSHGIEIGTIGARQSAADPIDDHTIVIRQRLTEAAFTGDFTLTSAEGVTVRMNADGGTSVETSGDAARGQTAAAPTVERRIAPVDGGGIEVTYVIRNEGIDERGIPGVRIASVEGLLIETDQYGRFHLTGIPGGLWERGRNFILKVDPATLPAGTQFTGDNSQLRRITPGIPVRFDFSVKLPAQMIPGGTRRAEIELGRVFFGPGESVVQAKYLPVVRRMADKVHEYGGGEVLIDANGDSETLAFSRAVAVKNALLELLDPPTAKSLRVSTRGKVDDPRSLIVGVDEGGALLGTVFFDTDKSQIRPEFRALLDRIAEEFERTGGGVIAVVGHTDVRGSYEYNTALGLRRAQAVYEALKGRLKPEVLAKIRVESSSDTSRPAVASDY